MSIAISEVQKLSPAEKIELYQLLENDPDVAAYTTKENTDEILFPEMNARDEAYQQGKLQLTSIADLEARLQTTM